MQKKIIALAITAALTAPALAYAEANVYGQFNLAVEMFDNGIHDSVNQMNSYGSRVGVKGTDALDGGITLDWQLEGNVDTDQPGGFSFGRESNLGLSSDMGTVRLGLQASPYKAMGRKLDLFGDSAADTRNLVGKLGAARGMSGAATGGPNGEDKSGGNSVSYKTPSMGGFTVVVATGFDNEVPLTPTTDNSYLGFAGMYEQGPLFVMVASANNDNGAGTEKAATKVGGSYTMDAITVNAVLESVSKTAATVETKNSNMYLGGKFAISSTSAVKLAYTSVGKETGADNAITQLAVGYDHGMSKSTTLYALFSKATQKAAGAADPSIMSVGLKHKF